MSAAVDLRAPELALDTMRGDTLPLAVEFYSDDEQTIPIDLTTATTISIAFCKDKVGGPVKLTLDLDDGLTIEGDDDNKLVLFSNEALAHGKYIGDVKILFPSTIKRTYARLIWTIHNST